MSGMPVQLIASPVTLPLADRSARAGSPANDFAGKQLDITDLLVTHPKATFVLRVAGPSMQEHGIDDGDIVVVDRELRARDGSIVVAVVERELVIRVQLGQQVGIGAARHGLPVAQHQVGV
ncbi:Peptidase S24-like [Comamonas thiooxydans]|nr:Peptidase S24-like [Comamonas thiooxydans]